MNKALPRVSPREAAVSAAAVSALLDSWAEQDCEMHSFMLMRHGKVAAEGYWTPYVPQQTHMMFSLSKSFTSTGVTLAVREGLLDYEDAVTSFFPEYTPTCVNMKAMKVKHLLSMCSGHTPNADFILNKPNPVKEFIESDVPQAPGGAFVYNTGATYMCSAIVSKLTGQPLLEYLKPRLFEPLGITDIAWDTCALGNSLGGIGLHLHTEDIAKFGVMLAAGGRYAGQQILTPEEIERMTCRRINNMYGTTYPALDDTHDEPIVPELIASDWAHGYGRQFWRCVPDGVFRGDGMYGQFCVVMPTYDLVLATTCGADDLQKVLTPVWDILLPSLEQPSSDREQAALDARLHALALSHPTPAAPTHEGGTHAFLFPEEQPKSWNSCAEYLDLTAAAISLDREPQLTLTHADGRTETLPVTEAWTTGRDMTAAGGWITPRVFDCRVVAPGTPFSFLLHFNFDGDSTCTFRPWNNAVTLLPTEK